MGINFNAGYNGSNLPKKALSNGAVTKTGVCTTVDGTVTKCWPTRTVIEENRAQAGNANGNNNGAVTKTGWCSTVDGTRTKCWPTRTVIEENRGQAGGANGKNLTDATFKTNVSVENTAFKADLSLKDLSQIKGLNINFRKA